MPDLTPMTSGQLPSMFSSSWSETAILPKLLGLVERLKAFIDVPQNMVYEQEWQKYLEESSCLRQELAVVTHLAERVLGAEFYSSSFNKLAHIAQVIRRWPEHPKRQQLLELFEHYSIDSQFFNLIDSTLSEHNGNLLALLNLDLGSELVVILEAQVERLSSQLRRLEKAENLQEKAEVLQTLKHTDTRAGFDKKVDTANVSVSDVEFTLSAIATLVVLSSGSSLEGGEVM